MKVIADLHIHSRYSRATSPEMDTAGIEKWAGYKGINVVGTGDFTHPEYLKHLQEKLQEAEPGLYRLKGKADSKVRFLCSVELSHIYKDGEKTRKLHHLVLAPSLEVAAKISEALGRRGNIESDGRPIFGIHSKDLVKLVLDISADAMIIPAHAWTPWFSVFGSKSGYDSLEECFGDQAEHIYAIETGLSSDRPMNRRCSMLDRVALISNSDAHSPSKLGREANVLQCTLSYAGVTDAIKANNAKQFPYTIEFFPEEGKYHYDGHRDCKVRFFPRESREHNNKCPVCYRPLTLGVLSRVEDLADRPWNYEEPQDSTTQKSIFPLEELLADAFDCGVATKKVQEEYQRLVAEGGSEFAILLDLSPAELAKFCPPKVAEGIQRMREGKVNIAPGYDGEFGRVSVFRKVEGEFKAKGHVQMKLL